GDERVHRTEEPHRQRAEADLLVHLPDHPARGDGADDERGKIVGDEVGLAEAAEGPLARDGGPEREHDERHRRRQHPYEELGAVGDRLGEADTQDRRIRLEDSSHGTARSSVRRSAKTWRMMSSSGGSSTVRSATGSPARMPLTTPRSASFPTRRRAWPSSSSTISPQRSRAARATACDSLIVTTLSGLTRFTRHPTS